MKKLLSLLLVTVLVFSVAGGSVSYAFAADKQPQQLPADLSVYTGEHTVNVPAVFDRDPDSAFAGYVDKVFMSLSEKAPVPKRDSAETLLPADSLELKYYDQLAPQIKKIADGQASSARITIDLEEAGMQTDYSPDDLGVTWIVAYDESAGGFVVNPDAIESFKELALPDDSILLNALLYTLPYDLYWFDKTAEFGVYWSVIFTGGINGDDRFHIIFNDPRYDMAVSDAYQDKDAEEPLYTVDTSIGENVQQAAQKAASVVAANKDKADFEKLLAYRDAVCGLADYNFDALEPDVPYGDPWQLIWVFDEDPSTKVVCEGYSKAFQYLFDMTDFRNDSISCRLVSGDMNGGGHMCNVVTMDDGLNYLADVTNCDVGDMGSDDLFLDGVTGSIDEGYSWDDQLFYTYDPDMIGIYGEDRIVLAGSHYIPLTVTAAKLELKSKIGIRLYFKAPEGATSAKILFEGYNYPNTSYDESKAITMDLDRSSRYYNPSTGEFLMIFPEITSRQMTMHIRFSVCNGNGDTLSIYYETENTWSDEYFEFCAADWADRIIYTYPSEKAVNMAKALLNYGGNAQVYLSNYNPSHPTNPNNYFASENAAVQADVNQNASIPSVAYDLGLDKIKLDLAADTSIRIYFNKPVTVQVDGVDAKVSNSGNTWLVVIKGITSRLLDHKYVIDVYCADGSAYGMTYSALSWANDKILNGPAEAQPTARSLYLYNQAAKAYLGN